MGSHSPTLQMQNLRGEIAHPAEPVRSFRAGGSSAARCTTVDLDLSEYLAADMRHGACKSARACLSWSERARASAHAMSRACSAAGAAMAVTSCPGAGTQR